MPTRSQNDGLDARVPDQAGQATAEVALQLLQVQAVTCVHIAHKRQDLREVVTPLKNKRALAAQACMPRHCS